MYQKQESSWLKHLDFLLLDILCLHLAFIVAYSIKTNDILFYANFLYRELGVSVTVLCIAVTLLMRPYRGVVRRDVVQELLSSLACSSVIMVGQLAFSFFIQASSAYSRAIILMMWGFSFVFMWVTRSLHKVHVRHYRMTHDPKHQVVLLVGRENAEHVLQTLTQKDYVSYVIKAILFLDESDGPTSYNGIPAICGRENATDFLAHNVVDELFVRLPNGEKTPEDFINTCREAGLTIHIGILRQSELPRGQSMQVFGDYYVLTSSIRIISPLEACGKRLLDICGGLAGLLIAGVVALFVGPAIYLASPGPIIFAQTRIGRNGRPFKFYKFRSMYMDAEARKAELMSQNKMNGLMFKIDNDPRIIKGIGHFIRKTSLDEFPQFWNVLRGDMSLVGTRPPTLQEYEQYELNHKSRLAFKPGITGLWQVSGRSDIVDFDEVIRLDTQYIETWELHQDLLILWKTVVSVVGQKGSE